jgi:hypothetical protein
MNKYLILLNAGRGRPLPLTDESDEICLYDSEEAAIEDAEKNILGQRRGYKIVCWLYFEE